MAVMVLLACSDEKKGNLHIVGEVKGLKKGELFLQKIENRNYVNLDSVTFEGKGSFEFFTNIEEPEVLYLYLVKDDGIDINDRLEFFAEPGEMKINSTRLYFVSEAKVEGSKSHDKLMEYRNMMSKFSNRNLELVKGQLEAQKEGNQARADSLGILTEKNQTRSYLYTLNFALTNKDSRVSPYITLVEANNAKFKFLDTINNSLTEEVANSKYGKALKEYILLAKRADLGM